MLDQNSELVEKYKSLVSVIQQNMETLKYSVDTEIIMDYLEPFEGASKTAQPAHQEELHTDTKKEAAKTSTRVVKKRLSGDFGGGTLSKKTHNNLSAKDLRQKVASPTDASSSNKEPKIATLSKKNDKTLSAKDVRAVKK
jgi:hypothetical protein